MKRFSTIALVMLALAAPVSAQQEERSGTGQGQGQGSGMGRTPAPTAQQPAPPPGRGGTRDAQPTNVRIDIVINDQRATGVPPITKSISLVLADQFSGRVRSSGQVQVPMDARTSEGTVVPLHQWHNVQLNADASVQILADDRLRASITLEYTPVNQPADGAAQAWAPRPLNETVTVILQHGKPLIITQAADPLSDRKITVEVTATILR